MRVSESPDAYTTPALLRYDGKEEIVVSGGDYVTGHDPATGAELWRAGGLNPGKDRNYRVVASPVVTDGMIYVPSRVRPLIAFRAGGRGDVTELAQGVVDRPGTRRADTGHRREVHLHRERPRHHVVPRREDRRRGLGQPARPAGHLQRVAGDRRRQGLRDQRGRRHDGVRGRPDVQGARRERSRATTRCRRRPCRTGRSSCGRTKYLYCIGKRVTAK